MAVVAFAGVTAMSLNTANAAGPAANPTLDCSQYTSSTGNIVLDEGECLDLRYVPDVVNADAESQRIALGLFIGTMSACANYHTPDQITSAGYSKPDGENLPWQHYGSDHPQTLDDIDAMIEESYLPPDVVVFTENGEIAQTMFSGTDIANLGSIPQLHDHRGEKWEMLHINCKPTIEEAFRYGGSDPQPTDPSVYLDAMNRAQTGGIAAVSTQMQEAGMGSPAPVASSPATAATGNTALPTARPVTPAPAATPTARSGVISSAPVLVAPWERTNTGTAASTVRTSSSTMDQLNGLSDAQLARLIELLDSES